MSLKKQQLDAWRSLLRGQALVVEQVERELTAAGLPPLGWYDVLTELDHHGGPGDALPDVAGVRALPRGALWAAGGEQ